MASPSRLPSVRRPEGNGSRSRPLSMFEVPTDHLNKLQQIGEGRSNGSYNHVTTEGTTSKQNKRRSLLPQFSTRKVSGDEKESPGTIQEDTSESEVGNAMDAKEDRKAMPPPPRPRPTSMRPPGTVVPNRTTSVHARNASKDSNNAKAGDVSSNSASAAAASRLDTGLKRTGSSRLPQSPKVGAPAAPGQLAISPRGSSTRATRATTAQKRSSVVLGKPPALDTSIAPSQSQASPASPTSTVTTRQSARTQLQPPRPTFSTYQQHYSPAKSSLPKPGLPSVKASKPAAAAANEADPAMTFEVAMEQIELLQLSLMHQSSAQVLEAYEASAKLKLGRTHAKLRKDYEAIRAHEQEHRKLKNLTALESWCPDPALLGEHLQTLSRVVADLRTHTEPGSRYSELTETFDKWATRAESILFDDQHPAGFIEALPEPWRSTHTSLALKIRSTQRDIGVLPPAVSRDDSETPSSLEFILESCSALVDSILKELEVMTKLQKEVLQRGKARIDEQINALTNASDNTRDLDKENWIPVWQSVT